MTFFGYMRRLGDELRAADVEVVLPDAEDGLDHHDPRQYELFRRGAVQRHLGRVRSRHTIGILVTNFDKHGIDDYIGPSTFVEIAAAAASNKRIFVLQDLPAVFRDALTDWDAIALRGRLDDVVDLYRRSCRPDHQLDLFVG